VVSKSVSLHLDSGAAIQQSNFVQFEIVVQLWLTQLGGVERHQPETRRIRRGVSDEVLAEISRLTRSSSQIAVDVATRLSWDQRQRAARVADR
jgi:hypothetical protein